MSIFSRVTENKRFYMIEERETVASFKKEKKKKCLQGVVDLSM